MGLLFAALCAVAEYYFYRRVVRSAEKVFSRKRHLRLRRIFVYAFVFFNVYPVFLILNWTYSSLFHSSIWVPANIFFDALIIFPFWFFILIAAQSILFFLPADFLHVILYLFFRRKKEQMRVWKSRAVIIITAAFVIYVPARVLYDYTNIDVRRVNYANKNIPSCLNGFKIALIADMQADRYTTPRRLNKFIADVNRAKPDLVLIGGDMITSTPDYIGEAAGFAGKIKSKYGIFACVGDHDNWAYRNDYSRSLNEVTAALEKHNIEMINNGERIIEVDTANILVTFVTNTYVEHIGRKKLEGLTDIKKHYDLKILLTHQPREFIAAAASKNNYNLMLAGHTHGGQITFLFPFKNLTPTLFETKYVRGNFWLGKMLLVVNRGLGMSLVPLRYNSTPEVTVLNILKNTPS